MDVQFYKEKFQKIADGFDKDLLRKKQLEIAVVEILDSVALKVYKKSWANKVQDPLTSRSRIFFSVWVNDKTLKQGKVSYNIHALKLRELEGYKIISTDFANGFRGRFKYFKDLWPNVRLDYGPLTLMEGWVKLDDLNFEERILALGKNFLKIDHIIDDLLKTCKK